jgi:hypothetical protein
MAPITGAGSPSIAFAALEFPRKYQIRTSVSNSMFSPAPQCANMEGHIHEILPIFPHAKSRMMRRLPFSCLCRHASRGYEHRPLLAAIENGYSLIAIEGTQNLWHTAAKIKN